MKTFIDLNGEKFENRTNKAHTAISNRYSSIYTAYVNPSNTKMRIWEEWKKWAYDLKTTHPYIEDIDLYITGRNAMQFSIGGSIYYTSGDIAHIYITKTRQEYWGITAPLEDIELYCGVLNA